MKKLFFLIAISAIALSSNAQDTLNLMPHFRLAINGGYSRRIAKTSDQIPAQFKDYISELKNGYHLGAEAAYFFNNKWSVGLKYNLFKAANSITGVTGTDVYGNARTGTISDDMQINFIGVNTSSRHISKNGKHHFLLGIGLGYMGYTNDAFLFDKIKITGQTFGATLDGGYDFRLAKNLFIGTQLSFVGGTLNSLDYDFGSSKTTVKLEENDRENLTRLDLSVGLRLNL